MPGAPGLVPASSQLAAGPVRTNLRLPRVKPAHASISVPATRICTAPDVPAWYLLTPAPQLRTRPHAAHTAAQTRTPAAARPEPAPPRESPHAAAAQAAAKPAAIPTCRDASVRATPPAWGLPPRCAPHKARPRDQPPATPRRDHAR